MKKCFELVQYNGIPYPDGYAVTIKEVAGHLDKEDIERADCYSLHTEYSYGKRTLGSHILKKYPALRAAQKDGVPQLWKSEEWAKEFSEFICELTRDKTAPHIIEIHPPFNDYTDIAGFTRSYKVFEDQIKQLYPNARIFMENRSGAVYRRGRFVVSKADEIVSLCQAIEENKLELGVVLDFPQLLTAERLNTLEFNADKYMAAIEKIHAYQIHIKGVHLWGKKKSDKGRWIAHCGTFDTYFGGKDASKEVFLNGIARVCDDGATRFLVPEVNSGAEDLRSIIADLAHAGMM